MLIKIMYIYRQCRVYFTIEKKKWNAGNGYDKHLSGSDYSIVGERRGITGIIKMQYKQVNKCL
jgi:hypothetical protein